MIKCIKEEIGLRPANKDEAIKRRKIVDSLEVGEECAIKIFTKEDYASYEQLKKYFAYMLPTLMYFVDGYEQYGNNKEAAHYALKIEYCMMVDMDLASIIKVNGEDKAIPFSLKTAIQEDSGIKVASKRKRNNFFKWAGERVQAVTGKGWDDSIALFQASS